MVHPSIQSLRWSLYPLACLLPLQEGLGTVGWLWVCLQVALWKRRGHVWQQVGGQLLWLSLLVGWVAGCCANWTSGLMFLRISSVFRYLPYLWFTLALILGQIVSWRMWWQVAWLALLGSGLAACIGLMDVCFDLSWLEQLLRKPGGASDQAFVPLQPGVRAAGGLFFHRLKLASVLLVPLAAAVVSLLASPWRTWWRWLLWWIGSAILCTALLWTYMRAAQLGLLVGSVAVACTLYGRRSWFVGLAVLLLAWGLQWWVPSVTHRLLSSGDLGVALDRGAIWRTAWQIIQDYPFGIGLGNYPQLVHRYYQLQAPFVQMRTYAHNVVLSTCAETGFLGLMAYGAFWGQLGFLFWQGSRHNLRPIGATGLLLWISVSFVGLTHDVFWAVGPGQFLLCALAWLAAALLRQDVEVRIGIVGEKG